MNELIPDRPFNWGPITFCPRLTAAQSGGVLSVTECTIPAFTGPARHVQHGEDETFIILEGRSEFWIEGRGRRILSAGQTLFVPRGVAHAFRTLTPVRHLVVMTPGGFEAFFAEMAAADLQMPRDAARADAIAARYNSAYTGPVLEPA